MTVELLAQMVTQNHAQNEDGHKRLRRDCDSLEERQLLIQSAQSQLELRLANLAALSNRPTDISTVVMSAKQVVAIVIVCVGIAGGLWVIRTDVHDLKEQMDSRSKLEDERATTFKKTMEDVQKDLKLYQIKTDGVEKALISKGVIR